MHELSPSEFHRVRPLFADIQYHRPAIFSVLEAIQPGRVFVDSTHDPAAVMLYSDFCYLAGEPQKNDFAQQAIDLLKHQVFPHRSDMMMIFPFNQAWQFALEVLLQPYRPEHYERSTFDFDPRRYRELHSGWQQRIPAGFSLRRLDASTLPEVGGMPGSWGSIDNFLANGFGFCLVDETQPDEHTGFAASAQTVFVGDHHAETGVGTREAYRRKGLATAVCCAYIDHCIEQGIIPDWGCVLNEASEQLAYKMGYTTKHNWPFTYIWIGKPAMEQAA